MANELIDLDAFVAPDIQVKLNGETYKLPGDAPSEIILRMTNLFGTLADEETGADNLDRILALREELSELTLELFQERQPELEDIRLTDGQIIQLVSSLMKVYTASDEEEAETDATRPTKPSAPKKKSGARSARNSRARTRAPSPSSTSSSD